MAGNQVLEWIDLDSEIKTAGLKNVSAAFYMPLADNIQIWNNQDPLAPPDL